MTTSTLRRLRSLLDRTGAQTVLVREVTAPARPPETVTVAPGAVAEATPEQVQSPLFVTAQAPSGRTIRRYDGTDVVAAVEYATSLVADRDPRAVWLCGHEQLRSWWSDGVASLLERRLHAAARNADARLVVWAVAEDGAVDDRYDVVFDP